MIKKLVNYAVNKHHPGNKRIPELLPSDLDLSIGKLPRMTALYVRPHQGC